MEIHPVGLVKALNERLPELLPAHAVHGAVTAEFADDTSFDERARGDYVYVQGRGDRLHAFLCVDGDIDSETLERFAACDANWRWLVAWTDDATPELKRRAAALGAGLIDVPRVGELRRVVEPMPRPGIFIKLYPTLRTVWRTMASW